MYDEDQVKTRGLSSILATVNMPALSSFYSSQFTATISDQFSMAFLRLKSSQPGSCVENCASDWMAQPVGSIR